MARRLSFVILVALATVAVLWAKDFWELPYLQWTQKDVNKLLQDSPWTLVQTFRSEAGGGRGGAYSRTSQSGEREVYDKYTILLFSSQPVRDGYARMMQIMNRYDTLDEAGKQLIDARTARVRSLEALGFSDRVIVAIHAESSLPDHNRDLKKYFDTQRADMLKEMCDLNTNSQGRIALKEYFPPSPDGTGLKLLFPRTVNGKPILDDSDKELRFSWWVEPLQQKVFVTWKTKNLLYQGKVEY